VPHPILYVKAIRGGLIFHQRTTTPQGTSAADRLNSDRGPPVRSIGYNFQLSRSSDQILILDHYRHDLFDDQRLPHDVYADPCTHVQIGQIVQIDNQRNAV